jgi:hypothetical protein
MPTKALKKKIALTLLLLLGMRSFLPGKPKAPTLEEIQELKESVPNYPKFRPHKSMKWLIFIVSNSDRFTHCCVSGSAWIHIILVTWICIRFHIRNLIRNWIRIK